MKRVNGFLFIVFVMLLLSGCSAKKIEKVASSEHLGYTIESIKNDFSLDDFELAGESKTGNEIVFSNPQGHIIRFASYAEESPYTDFILIASPNREDLFSYLEKMNKFMEIYEKEDGEQIKDLCNTQDKDLDQLSGRRQVIGDISYRFNMVAGAKNTYSLQLARPRDNSK
ncbi:MAG: hypothetical protein HFE64_02635 [Lachnospiraceae bacterium]|jgi:hypothetical protein|nr:hypothetical protein [Lachnospiraceae bacterium]